MPILEFEIRKGSTKSKTSWTEVFEIPNVKRIKSVRAVHPTGGGELNESLITHSIDREGGSFSLFFNDIPSTGSTQQWTALVSSTIQGDKRVCRYANGTTTRISPQVACTSQKPYTRYGYSFDVTVDYDINTPPMIASDTPDLDELFENDPYIVKAEVNEPDPGDNVTVYCQVNDDVPQPIAYFTSESLPLSVEREFRYQNGRFVDQESGYSVEAADDVMHTVRIWASDEFGGQSEDLVKEFTVDSNQPPVLTVEPIADQNFLLAEEQLVINGTISDGNGGEMKLSYRLNDMSWIDTYEGTDSPFSILVPLPLLQEGENTVQLRVVDEFGAMDEATVVFEKELVRYPLHRSDIKYRINIPSRKAQTMTLKVMREMGDLTVTANVSMTGGEADELFVAMTKTGTQAAGEGMEEDTFSYTATEPMEKILFQIVMERQDVSSTAKVRRVTGTLN